MPEFTYETKLAIMAEQAMWNVVEILGDQQRNGVENQFYTKMAEIEKQAKALARELRDYNNQFEVEE